VFHRRGFITAFRSFGGTGRSATHCSGSLLIIVTKDSIIDITGVDECLVPTLGLRLAIDPGAFGGNADEFLGFLGFNSDKEKEKWLLKKKTDKKSVCLHETEVIASFNSQQ
jgi:hypothetical protein